MKFNNKVYNVLKWIALIFLPALSTLVIALGDIWGLPYKEQVSLTIAALDTFLGALLAISSFTYKGEGTMEIGENDDETTIILESEDALEKAQKAGKILLSVTSAEE